MPRPSASFCLRTTLGLIAACWAIAAGLAVGDEKPSTPPPRSTSTVGMPARIEQLVLPGTELEAKPIEDRGAPMVVRVVESYPHGSAFRYDIVYYGLDPGRYDLKDDLRRKDGSPMTGVPSILVSVQPVLPPGQVEPHQLILGPAPTLGGYRLLVIAGGLLWFAVLAGLALAGRRRRRIVAEGVIRRATLADRLRPLVEAAMAGRLDAGRRAELERLLIGYWQRRLGLEDRPPARVMAVLREHPDAGALFRKLEDWLHRPAGSAGPVDVAALLAPYRDIPAGDEDEDREGEGTDRSPPSPVAGPARSSSRSEVSA
ncbi:MAG: hypothetical protein ACYC61_21890 [Isosphaeraceae bacterium]